jgi:transcriptional regulator with XRE-family HTH domain
MDTTHMDKLSGTDDQPRRHTAPTREGTMQLGSRLRQLRTLKGATQANMAQELGISESMYRNWEAGRQVPLLTMGLRIADAFGVPVWELFGSAYDLVPTGGTLDNELNALLLEAQKLPREKRRTLTAVASALADQYYLETTREDALTSRPAPVKGEP